MIDKQALVKSINMYKEPLLIIVFLMMICQ